MSLAKIRSGVTDTPFLLVNLGKHTEVFPLMRMDSVYSFGQMRRRKMKRLITTKIYRW